MTTEDPGRLYRTYRMSGTVLEVSGHHSPILDAIHARLKWATVADTRPDVRICVELTDRLPDWRDEASAYRVVLDHPQAQIHYDADGDRVLAAFGSEGAGLVDGRSLSAALHVRSKGGREAWMGSHPLFTPALTELLKRRGLFSLHAAGASVEGKAILIAGASGAGKSTLSIALARRGFGFLSDDRIFLEMVDGEPRVLPFPDDIDLREGTPGLFAELRPILDAPKPEGWPKWKLSAESFYQATVPASCEPGLLLFPKISPNEESRLEELGPNEALAELVPNVVLTKLEPTRAHLDALAKLTRASRCYRLNTGRDFDRLADRLHSLALERPEGSVV